MDELFGEASEKLIGALEKYVEGGAGVKDVVEIGRVLDCIEEISGPGAFERKMKEMGEKYYEDVRRVYERVERVEVAMEEGRKMVGEGGEIEGVEAFINRILKHGKKLSKSTKCPPLWEEGQGLGEGHPSFPNEELVRRSALFLEGDLFGRRGEEKDEEEGDEDEKDGEGGREEREKEKEFSFEI